jgi:hypothetical protein
MGGIFTLATISFVVQKLFNFIKSRFFILSLSFWASGVLLMTSLPIPIRSRVFPASSYSNFRVLGLILTSFIHFESILVQGDRCGFSFIFLLTANHRSQQHVLKRLSFLHRIFLAPFS